MRLTSSAPTPSPPASSVSGTPRQSRPSTGGCRPMRRHSCCNSISVCWTGPCGGSSTPGRRASTSGKGAGSGPPGVPGHRPHRPSGREEGLAHCPALPPGRPGDHDHAAAAHVPLLDGQDPADGKRAWRGTAGLSRADRLTARTVNNGSRESVPAEPATGPTRGRFARRDDRSGAGGARPGRPPGSRRPRRAVPGRRLDGGAAATRCRSSRPPPAGRRRRETSDGHVLEGRSLGQPCARPRRTLRLRRRKHVTGCRTVSSPYRW